MNVWPGNASPELCVGRVFHKRFRPVDHQFSYGVFFLRVPLSRLTELSNRWLSVDRFNLLSFSTADYGPRDGTNLEAWMRGLLLREGIDCADGEVVLQTFPRLLGYVFNPISVWYCFDKNGLLRAALAEVRNTFGEHHNYLVAHADQRPIKAGDWLTSRKVFHVSPFCEVKGHYRFRFEQVAGRAYAQIDYYDANDTACGDAGKLIVTTLHGAPEPLTSRTALRAFIGHPFMTFGVVARIHWHALKLWLKHVPFFTKPEPPSLETTR
ncbi:MAG: DUF1365 domain-containing protein [Burkholderiales bacterium]|nr:DUF1365 domain-containing protein [Burkholderiales bacterium]